MPIRNKKRKTAPGDSDDEGVDLDLQRPPEPTTDAMNVDASAMVTTSMAVRTKFPIAHKTNYELNLEFQNATLNAENQSLKEQLLMAQGRNQQLAEEKFMLEGGKKGVITPTSMNSFLGALVNCPATICRTSAKRWRACNASGGRHATPCTSRPAPGRSAICTTSVVFRVKFLKLEQIDPTHHTLFRKQGDYRVHGTLIEAKGCNSL